MIKANVSYLVENVGMDGYLHLVYVELGNANLGIANCPGDGGYYVVHEGRYDELKKAVKMGGETKEVDGRKVAPVFLAARNDDGLGDEVKKLIASLSD